MLPFFAAAATAGALLYREGYRVKFKDGVVLALAPEMARALPLIEQAHQDADILRGAFITSGKDGKHMPGSLHYVGKAVDLRTRDLAPGYVSSLAAALRRRLGNAFDVVVESDHIHVEYDPK